MKKLVLAVVAVVFTSQAFAQESEEIQVSQASCLEQGAQELITMLNEGGYEYKIVRTNGNIPEILKPAAENEQSYQLSALLRHEGNLEEYMYGSDFNSSSVYVVMKVGPNGTCETHDVGMAQDDGD